MKACIKFLSVLLIVTMCVGFMPPAHALFIGVDESYVPPVKSTASPEQAAAPETAPSPQEGAGLGAGTGVMVAPVPAGTEEILYEYTVTNCEQLREAVAKVGYKGTVTLGDHITDMTFPLSIDSSLTLDLNGYTLGFMPGKTAYDYAVEISSNADEVFIINGTISTETSTVETETETVSLGYYHVIGSDAGELHVDDLVVEGELLEQGSSFVKKDEKSESRIQVAEGTYPTDPTNYVDEDLYTVTDNGNGTWTVTKKAVEEEADGGNQDGAAANPDISTMLPGPGLPIGGPEIVDDNGLDSDTDADTDKDAGGETETDPGAAQGQDAVVTGPAENTGMPGLTQVIVPDQTITQESAVSLLDYMHVCDSVILDEDVTIDEFTTDSACRAEINLNGHTLTVNGGFLISSATSNNIFIYDGALNAKITNAGTLTLSGVTQVGTERNFATMLMDIVSGGSSDVTNTGALTLTGGSSVGSVNVQSGYVELGDGSIASASVNSAGSYLIVNGGNVGPVSVSGGSLNVNSGSVGKVTVENGKLTVNDGTLDSVKLSGACELNVYNGTINSLKAASGAQISGDLVKGGTVAELDEVLLAEGYSLNADHGIMPITITGRVEIVDEGPDRNLADNNGGLVFFSGGAVGDGEEPYFVFSYATDAKDAVEKVTIQRKKPDSTSFETATDLVLNTDYTWKQNNNGGTLTLKASGKLSTATPGAYVLTFTLKGTSEKVEKDIFVYPPITPKKTYYQFGDDEGGYQYEIKDLSTTNKPDPVTFDRKLDQNTTTMKVDPKYYTIVGDIFTLSPDFISKQEEGTYYIGLWYGSSCIYLPVSVGEDAPTVKPASREWVYTLDKDDQGVKFSVSTNNSRFTSMLDASRDDYSISSDGRTITVKTSYLSDLVTRATGDGHGAHTLSFMTNVGPVSGIVYVTPGIWPVDGKDNHMRGTDEDLVFQASAPFDKSYVMDINDKEILPEDYDGYYTDGNYLYLRSDFLNQRKSGTFKVYMGVEYTEDGVVKSPVLTTYFSINGSSARPGSSSGSGTSPATGDENSPLLWLAVLALSGGAAVALMPRKKKQNPGDQAQ